MFYSNATQEHFKSFNCIKVLRHMAGFMGIGVEIKPALLSGLSGLFQGGQ